MLPFVLNNKNLTVLFDGRAETIESDSPVWKDALEALKAKDFEALEILMKPVVAINKWTHGKFTITEDGVFHNGERIHHVMEARIIEFWQQQLPVEPLLNFWERLQANPSNRAVNELYGFLEHRNLPINEKGFFIAYKAVRADFYDIFSGKHLNTIGSVLEMPRRSVDDDARNTCSHGFHVGALEYVRWYGQSDSKILICEVDPADVVSIPVDHNAQKVRTCRYKVLELYTAPLPDGFWSSDSYSSQDDEGYDEDWDEELNDEDYFDACVEDNTCPYCGESIHSHWEYCPSCGGDLSERDYGLELLRDK